MGSCRMNIKSPRDKPLIVTSTGMLGDLLQAVGGNEIDVKVLMGPGVDPHSYKASHRDVASILEADAIFYQGLHLEGKLQNHLQKQGNVKPVFALAEQLDTALLIGIGHQAFDPHIWMDARLWIQMVEQAIKALVSLYPEHRTIFQENGQQYIHQLHTLDDEIRETLNQIPPKKRILVTAHDAFSYFGKAYGWDVNALQGLSTVNEFGIKDVQALVQFTLENQIGALFIEQSVSDKSIRAIIEGVQAKGGQVRLGGTLYSDALGGPESSAASYIGMMQTNARTIAEGLK
jgi:manganese/zinc/iron transport system substrate-binding protein